MIDRGALMSRYSRTAKFDIRELYDSEFAGNSSLGADFYRRIFIEYGDESISELVTAQLGIQGISNICAQTMEDTRIGLSFLEKSSRYVRYDRKINGKYPYLSGEECGFSGQISKDYESLCDDLFNFYTHAFSSLLAQIESKVPLETLLTEFQNVEGVEGEKIIEKAYRRAVNARALDDARFILPASTKTNLGISGNARAYINMILRMKSSRIPEISNVANEIERELEPEFPQLIEAARDDHAREAINFRRERNSAVYDLLSFDSPDQVTLISSSTERDFESIYSAIARDRKDPGRATSVEEMSEALASLRKNRRDKPGRLFEIPDLVFLINMSFGTFRDFHRHRMFTMIRGPLRSSSSKFVPELIAEDSELLKQFMEIMERSHEVWKSLVARYGVDIAQYSVPFAQKYGFLVKGSLQEFTYFTELRTTPAAHYEIRDVSTKIYGKIRETFPRISKVMKFVDTGRYDAGRIYEEVRKEIKRGKIWKSKP